jgi:hypothetical protein
MSIILINIITCLVIIHSLQFYGVANAAMFGIHADNAQRVRHVGSTSCSTNCERNKTNRPAAGEMSV